MRKKYTLQLNDTQYTLGQRTWIMGIVNVTPDSFSDGGLYLDRDKAVERGLELVKEGSNIIDIGGESSRPGSESISVKEELRRVIPVISALREKTDALISIDTTKAEVAEAAVKEGADIINDISAFRFDKKMFSLAAQHEVAIIIMHMKGTPKTMQIQPRYDNLLSEVISFLKERIIAAQTQGIKKERIIVDPGIGFGKRVEDNLSLIHNLNALEELERPILVGVSRKSFIGNILNLPPSERLEGTIASAVLSIAHGAHILRIHDVKSVKRAIFIAESIMNKSPSIKAGEENKEINSSYVR